MTFVVTDACIRCKYTDCVEVCPTEAFREGATMLVIDPNACIDCSLCLPECPADAIRTDIDPGVDHWLELNAKYAVEWPSISVKKDAPVDADEFKGIDGKFDRHFSPDPGKGD